MTHKLNIFNLFIAFFVATAAFSQNPAGFDDMAFSMADKSVPLIYAHQIKELKAKNKKIVFIDTREIEEYKVSHIKNAKFVGYDNFNAARLKGVEKSTIVIVYCSVGYRSGIIGKKLISLGYKQVFNLFGGIFSWANNENPVFSNNNEVKKVHPYNNKWGKWLNSQYWK